MAFPASQAFGRTRGNDGSDDGATHRRLAVHYLNWVTIPAIANEFGEAQDELHLGSLMYLALIFCRYTAG